MLIKSSLIIRQLIVKSVISNLKLTGLKVELAACISKTTSDG